MNVLKNYTLGALLAVGSLILTTGCDEHRAFQPIKPDESVNNNLDEACMGRSCKPVGEVTDPQKTGDALSNLLMIASSDSEIEIKTEMSNADAKVFEALDIDVIRDANGATQNEFIVEIQSILNVGLENELVDLKGAIKISSSGQNIKKGLDGLKFNPEEITLSKAREEQTLAASSTDALVVDSSKVAEIDGHIIVACTAGCAKVLVNIQVNGEDAAGTNGAMVVLNVAPTYAGQVTATLETTTLGANKSVAQREAELNAIFETAEAARKAAADEAAAKDKAIKAAEQKVVEAQELVDATNKRIRDIDDEVESVREQLKLLEESEVDEADAQAVQMKAEAIKTELEKIDKLEQQKTEIKEGDLKTHTEALDAAHAELDELTRRDREALNDKGDEAGEK